MKFITNLEVGDIVHNPSHHNYERREVTFVLPDSILVDMKDTHGNVRATVGHRSYVKYDPDRESRDVKSFNEKYWNIFMCLLGISKTRKIGDFLKNHEVL